MIELTKAQARIRTSLSAFITEGNPVAVSVETLRETAIGHAAEFAQKKINEVTAELAASGNDLEVCAPYPDHKWRETHHYYERAAAQSKYQLFSRLTRTREGSHRPGTPRLADMSDPCCVKYIENAKHDTAIQYDAFVVKLVHKVGPVVKAECASHAGVWGRSTLTVTQKDGKVQNWLTQQIINYSVLGNAYNQWPTRKVK